MSHYSVAVISKNPADVGMMLGKYEDCLSVSPYTEFTKEEAILKFRNDKEESLKNLKEALESANFKRKIDLLYAISKCEKDLKLSDEEVYEEFAQYWYGRNLKDLEEDNLIGPDEEFLSTSSPDPKWDWYVEGGRWNGLITLKREKETDPVIRANVAKIKDIDFNYASPEDKKYNEMLWEKVVEGKHQDNHELFIFYDKEYLLDRYKTKENFVKSVMEFRTYAILTPENGSTWYEPGQMGLFGMSNDNLNEEREFSENYFKMLDVEKYKDYYLTIIDCHI